MIDRVSRLQASGLPEGMMAAALRANATGQTRESAALERRARTMGFGTPARRASRDHSRGSGCTTAGPATRAPRRPGGDIGIGGNSPVCANDEN